MTIYSNHLCWMFLYLCWMIFPFKKLVTFETTHQSPSPGLLPCQELDEVLGLHRPTPLGASGAQWFLAQLMSWLVLLLFYLGKSQGGDNSWHCERFY